jgi:uncharacterized protein YkwD
MVRFVVRFAAIRRDRIISALVVYGLTQAARRHVQCSGRTRRNVLTARNIFFKLPFITAAVVLLVIAATVLLNAPPSSADPAQDSEEQQFLVLINNYRISKGAVPLLLQDDLNEAADWYATDMATKNYFGSNQYCAQFGKTAHCDSLGRMPPERAKFFGYPQSVGENSAAGFSTAQAVFDAWKASPGHNSNMLGSSYRAIGIGRACNSSSVFGCYWVTDFGFYTGPGSPPPPSSTSNPTSSPTAQPTQRATPTPTPTPQAVGTHVWDDINCDGSVTAQDAVQLLRGDVGITTAGGSCPAISDLVVVKGTFRVWGDTDCSQAVAVLDSIKLLAYLAGVSDGFSANCPSPGSRF